MNKPLTPKAKKKETIKFEMLDNDKYVMEINEKGEMKFVLKKPQE